MLFVGCQDGVLSVIFSVYSCLPIYTSYQVNNSISSRINILAAAERVRVNF